MKIGIYVQQKYIKRSFSKDCYDKRNFRGIEVIKDVIEREGRFETGYCGKLTVRDYDVILVSIISPLDWFSFIKERCQWEKGDYTIIVGGAGIDNVVPFLEYADIFVFGRGEDLIVPLLNNISNFEHPSICRSKYFSFDKEYLVNQAGDCYPHTIKCGDKTEFTELSIGCKRKCLFCKYTFDRKLIVQNGVTQDYLNPATERNFWDIGIKDTNKPLSGKGQFIVGLDGCSERLRCLVNKPISNQDLSSFFMKASLSGGLFQRIRLFNLVGLPTETKEDRRELKRIFLEAKIKGDKRIAIYLSSMHFHPMPNTPAATWPMSILDYRKLTIKEWGYGDGRHKYEIAKNGNLVLCMDNGTESLPTSILWMLITRGDYEHAEIIRKIALSTKFFNANTKAKLDTLEKYIDIDNLCGWKQWDDLPTRYLHTYISRNAMMKLSDNLLSKYGDTTREKPPPHTSIRSAGNTMAVTK